MRYPSVLHQCRELIHAHHRHNVRIGVRSDPGGVQGLEYGVLVGDVHDDSEGTAGDESVHPNGIERLPLPQDLLFQCQLLGLYLSE